MITKPIDINCDLGEGMANDAVLMPFITSCSIACGGHFGNRETILNTVKLAQLHQVKVGAHPSFPDRENFGRQMIPIDNESLMASVFEQIMLFKTVCDSENVVVNHVKLHGALYNLAAKSEAVADLIIQAMLKTGLTCKLYAPYGSVLANKGKVHFDIYHEAFIDRTYHTDLSLLNRTAPLALITSPMQAWKQLSNMVTYQKITSFEGHEVAIFADTYCVHGDNKTAVDLMVYIHEQLQKNKISHQDD